MADSDDEYDRKRRDKFRGERGAAEGSSYRSSDRREERSRGREEWSERSRGGRSGPDYRDYRGGGSASRGYSPVRGEGPPNKRLRPEWPVDDRRYGGMPHDSYGSYGWAHDHFGPHPAHQGYGQPMPPVPASNYDIRDAVLPTGPTDGPSTMMSFKAFLAAQDDSITVDDAITKYNEYKLDFRRQQLNEFFVAHKDEEWFKIKYHPEESVKRKEEQLAALKNRLNVFLELLEQGELDKVSVDVDKSDKLIRLLDTVVIKLEGGTEEDLKILDEPAPSENATNEKQDKAEPEKAVVIDVDAVKVKDEKEDKEKEEIDKDKKSDPESPKPTAPLTMEIDPHLKQLQEQAKLFSRYNTPPGTEPGQEVPEKEPPPPGSSSSSSSSGSSSSSSEDEGESTRRKSKSKSKSKSPVKSPKAKSRSKSPVEKTETDSRKDKEDDKSEEANEVGPEKKEVRALHKTTSIFLRNLAPTITKAEVEAMCKRYGGFLRVALADPLPERRWFRRGWVTFRREVNIKDICWNLNNIRLRECELGAIVNRDLQRRIRPVSGVTIERVVMRADARLAARLAHLLDTRTSLWGNESSEENNSGEQSINFNSNNPVLHNITEHLIEEASTEEEELLGLEATTETNGQEVDPELMRVLDRLVLYLRIVHSVDYYNHCEYPYEDEMPNRCGIMHARSGPPINKPTQQEIQDYIKTFESKMSAFLQDVKPLPDDELQKLGIKDSEAEVEKFIQANTQELDVDKWLCPLSGKKFKGPDFIRKHIFNKHGEKVDEVRREVSYFNAYVRDVRRPQQPEPATRPSHHAPPHPAHHAPPPAPYGGGGAAARGWGWGGWAPPAPYAPRHPRFSRPRENVDRSRPIIAYNDLDFPDSGDIF
ncbi:serrate RNA effector molecule homolog isoform X2 [Pieris napi]|uniref:serrate RNA effector molecule homolog isoform X2 n=1 Tax=Pieris napi TaxID=78633 RepID=UPI001FBACADB|nr:serrate RNA effector molecule homolog isoform X2 [Pieris napi]